ncbi:MAG TPA: PIN domain-containing protein [Burkholderiales bacterium]|jgi:predicted nucleic acid-binding protein|nr:PIN domain-containing protein [Burkholderiales bacterium]
MLTFVDTNVLVYSVDPRDPLKKSRANAWLHRLWQQRSGRTSVQVLAEFYTSATRKIAPRMPSDQAWEEATRYFVWAPRQIDMPLLVRARDIERRYAISWWDSMVVAAAVLQDCQVLLTEDLQDGMVFGTLAVRSPFSTVIEEPAAAYEVEPAAPLHRPRGRPKRLAA